MPKVKMKKIGILPHIGIQMCLQNSPRVLALLIYNIIQMFAYAV